MSIVWFCAGQLFPVVNFEYLVEIKSLRNDAKTTPKRVPNEYHPFQILEYLEK